MSGRRPLVWRLKHPPVRLSEGRLTDRRRKRHNGFDLRNLSGLKVKTRQKVMGVGGSVPQGHQHISTKQGVKKPLLIYDERDGPWEKGKGETDGARIPR